MSIFVFFPSAGSKGAFLSTVPSDGPSSHKYGEAISLLGSFPKIDDAVMCFDPNFPENTDLLDIVNCLDGVVVINQKVKKIFESLGVNGEFLNVRIWDHQDKTVSDNYFIFNCLSVFDFIDMEKSKVAMSPFFPDRIKRVKSLVVNQDADIQSHAFVPKGMEDQIFITEKLKTALEAEGVTGFKVFEAEGWDGLDV
ncbi:imm11 family protein [Psychromonas algicola]|uniref:imm11 family protein n=1 Tax=Psychromonas algicola TaxID=2555642 RepID=UPI00106898CD|nr:DUF1629 domain-containing protein [Psychromonas sp. RZ5]TEW45110.1 hypothetical protein E2R67_14390 [Psychromonas sp. RZ5]